MNLYHVQASETWKTASKDCRSEFIEVMRDKSYGAQETLEAWDWFHVGWTLAVKAYCQ